MSPVDRDGSVPEISPHHVFICKNSDAGSYEKAGWLSYRDPGFQLPRPR